MPGVIDVQDPDTDDLAPLRAANPVRMDSIGRSSLERIHGSVTVGIARGAGPRPSRRRARGMGFGLAGAVAAFAVVALSIWTTPGPNPGSATAATVPAVSATQSDVPDPGGLASCVRVYSLELLRDRSWAFDGIVTDIAGDVITFEIVEGFRGSADGSVTLRAVGWGGTDVESEGGPYFEVGQRFLVTGADGNVWGCGFTQPYDANTAAKWRTTLGR